MTSSSRVGVIKDAQLLDTAARVANEQAELARQRRLELEGAASDLNAKKQLVDQAVAGVPAQVQALAAPALGTLQTAANTALERSNLAGAVGTDAELAGRPAGQYRVGRELVQWNGNSVTSRTAALATAQEVGDAQALADAASAAAQALRLGSVDDLTTLPALPGDVLMVAGSRGGRFVVRNAADAPPADNGVVFPLPGGRVAVREREGRVRGVWYGLVPDGDLTLPGAGTDNGPALTALFEAVNRYGGLIDLDAGTYRSSVRLPTLGNKPFRLEAGGVNFVFSVKDTGSSGVGMPMLGVTAQTNWYASIGLIRQLGLPTPSRATTEGLTPDGIAPAGWGDAFQLRSDLPAARYWRTHNDHGINITNCADFELHAHVDGVRAMGMVLNNCQRGVVYGTVRRTLADGLHGHNGTSRCRIHVDADTTGDDGIALISKSGEPEMLDNILDVTSIGSLARGVTVSGAQNTTVLRADARDAWMEGVLILAEALEGANTLYTRVVSAFAVGCARNPDAAAAGTCGIRIGYPNSGARELYTEIESARAINNLGGGIRIHGRYNRIGRLYSQGNALPDVIEEQNELEIGQITVLDGAGLIVQGVTDYQIGEITARRNTGHGVEFQGSVRGRIGRVIATGNGRRGIRFSATAGGTPSVENEIGEVIARDNAGSDGSAADQFQVSVAVGCRDNVLGGGTVTRGGSAASALQLLAPTHLRDMVFEGFSGAVQPIAASPAALAGSRWERLRGWGLSRGTNLEGNPYGPTPAPAHATPVTAGPHRVRVHVTERGGAVLQGLNVTRDGVTTDYIQAAPNVRTLELEPGDVLNPYWAGGTVTWFWEIN